MDDPFWKQRQKIDAIMPLLEKQVLRLNRMGDAATALTRETNERLRQIGPGVSFTSSYVLRRGRFPTTRRHNG